MAFKIPDTMELGHTETIDVHIATDAFGKDLRMGLEGRGVFHNESLPVVTPVMSVELHGDGFRITPLFSNPQRSISDANLGEWQWDVTPTRGGQETLEVVVSAQVGTNPPVFAQVKREDIKVRVNALALVAGFARDNWQYLLSLAPLGFLGAWVRRRYGQQGVATAPTAPDSEDVVNLKGQRQEGSRSSRRSGNRRRN
jgi:hypothetical protein